MHANYRAEKSAFESSWALNGYFIPNTQITISLKMIENKNSADFLQNSFLCGDGQFKPIYQIRENAFLNYLTEKAGGRLGGSVH